MRGRRGVPSIRGVAPGALEREGIVVRQLYCERPPRYDYVLTPAGEELMPILEALKQWGDRHGFQRLGVSERA
ncbi:helix-turn-helix domain-containing protein [Patulibacter sp. NPDC049589]|uniref:winged helix-turn-helix transcriptional regulator n=1 Tax=Patulibacter sp. NPDC049589 TaxID=3154731 RepID=UPI0034299C67